MTKVMVTNNFIYAYIKDLCAMLLRIIFSYSMLKSDIE